MNHGPRGVNVPVKSVKTKQRPEAELAPTDRIQKRSHVLLKMTANLVCFEITSYYTYLIHDSDTGNRLSEDLKIGRWFFSKRRLFSFLVFMYLSMYIH